MLDAMHGTEIPSSKWDSVGLGIKVVSVIRHTSMRCTEIPRTNCVYVGFGNDKLQWTHVAACLLRMAILPKNVAYSSSTNSYCITSLWFEPKTIVTQ